MTGWPLKEIIPLELRSLILYQDLAINFLSQDEITLRIVVFISQSGEVVSMAGNQAELELLLVNQHLIVLANLVKICSS
jgi:hypothetical protein